MRIYKGSVTTGEHDLYCPGGTTNTLKTLEIVRKTGIPQDKFTVWIDRHSITMTWDEFYSVVREIM